MSSTENKVLKQCKIKFRNCYKLNDGVPNIPVFVDKFLNRIQIWKFSMDGLSHFAGQLALFALAVHLLHKLLHLVELLEQTVNVLDLLAYQ